MSGPALHSIGKKLGIGAERRGSRLATASHKKGDNMGTVYSNCNRCGVTVSVWDSDDAYDTHHSSEICSACQQAADDDDFDDGSDWDD